LDAKKARPNVAVVHYRGLHRFLQYAPKRRAEVLTQQINFAIKVIYLGANHLFCPQRNKVTVPHLYKF